MKRFLSALDFIKKSNSLSQKNMEALAEDAIDSVKNGEINPLDAYVMIEFLEKLSGQIRAGIKDVTINHIKASGEKTAYNTSIILRDVPSYNYAEDDKWNKENAKLALQKRILDDRTKILKKLIEDAKNNNLASPISIEKVRTDIVVDYKSNS